MCSEVFSLNSHLNPLLNLQFEFPPKNGAPLSSKRWINQLPMPFVASVHLNEIALAALHQTIHNDTSSTLNLGGPLYILTTAEGTLSLRSRSFVLLFPRAFKYIQGHTDGLSFMKLSLFVKGTYTAICRFSSTVNLKERHLAFRGLLPSCESVKLVAACYFC